LDYPRKPAITVAICTLNRAAKLAECLRHVVALDYPNFEVLVVDNGSTDETREVASSFGVRYVSSPIRGLSRARNDAARHCRTEIIAYIDDDAVPNREWLSALADEFVNPEVMAVAGHVESGDQDACSSRGERRVIDKSDPDWFSITNFGGVGDGGNMAFRRSAFAQWPGFDERLGLGGVIPSGEEHRAFFSLVALGWRCVSTPEAIVRHHDTWSDRGTSNLASAVANSLLLLREEPQWRFHLLNHVANHLLRKSRSWRRHRELPAEHPLHLAGKLSAAMQGLRFYRRATKLPHSAAPLLEPDHRTVAR
jgi:glycosyltransferase involved in cell wall biosynthesis